MQRTFAEGEIVYEEDTFQRLPPLRRPGHHCGGWGEGEETRTHGYKGTPVYDLWGQLVKRCENTKAQNYKWYGGRGIKVADVWRYHPEEFCEWALKNGYKKGLEIDRIDTNGDYSPENCQFITHKENCAPGKRRLRKTNKTGERNVTITKHGTFEAWAYINGKQKYIGTFKTVEDAANARDKAESIGTVFDEDAR